jgi:integrase
MGSSDSLRGHLGKSDIRYWQKAVFRQKYTRNGVAHQVSEWAIKLQRVGRREIFPLGTANRAAAAAKAREIHRALQTNGWEETMAKFKPRKIAPFAVVGTVGEFLAQVAVNTSAKAKTVRGYSRALRTIVAQIEGIEGGREKYDYRNGGHRAWLNQIHNVDLAVITPEKVHKWKIEFVRRAGSDPTKERVARISVNSLMRQAKSLFAPAMLKFVTFKGLVPNPFDGVDFEPGQSMRYRSDFNVPGIIRAAQKELPLEQLKIFLLAVMAGLRRNEIDKLEWSAFRWKEAAIRIEVTRYFHPKTQNSEGDVSVDSEFLKVFRKFRNRSKGSFVISSSLQPRMDATYSHYRCQRDFEALAIWLRNHNVNGSRPLHTLRKEYGSQICAKHGIYAASYALRHGDIAITSRHYLDRRKRATPGLGRLLIDSTLRRTPDGGSR